MTASPAISCAELGTLPDGRWVQAYTLTHGGLGLTALTLGGIVTRLWVPDRQGRLANVVLGFDTLADYVERNPNFGVIVGRYANRIAGARFVLDGETHRLSSNDGQHCLHGGARGFGKQLWQAEPIKHTADGGVGLLLSYTSADGEEGFPGELSVRVRYTLGPDTRWRIDYEAETDRTTVVNLSHHDYLNLAGSGSGSAMGQRLTIHASRYSEVDETLIPTGVAEVAGTPFDFRQPTLVETRLRQGHPQLARARGYDHNWWLDHPADGALHPAARLEDPDSGRVMDLLTTEPALQFYSGNFLDGRLVGTGGRLVRQGDGLCLETQHAPDSPHQSTWPSTVLRPGQTYRSSTVHRFGLC